MFALIFGALALYVRGLFSELRTNAGRDWQARIMGDTASNATGVYAAGNYMALSTDATATDATRTTLPGEITTSDGSHLNRQQAAYSHTNGQNTYTLTKTFVSDGTSGTSPPVAKIGIFTAASGGTLVFETMLNATASLVTGDQLAITQTITL